jgi:MraZ protein
MVKKTTQNSFFGQYSYSIDSKGRVNIPAKFRQVLSSDNDKTFIITRGEEHCIWVYPLVVWQEIVEGLRKLSAVSPNNRYFIRKTTRYASLVEYDKQGRIMLTKPLIDYAGLNKEVNIIGALNKLEIWNPETLDKVDSDDTNIDAATLHELANEIIL